MALIKCPECGKEVSELSESCIGCGYPISKFLAKQKIDKEILSVDVQNDCKAIRYIFTEFRNSYVPLSGMKININDIREIVKGFNAKINLLNIEAQKEIRGKFAESFCIGLCENTNLDVLNFNDVKSMCDIINISNISEQSAVFLLCFGNSAFISGKEQLDYSFIVHILTPFIKVNSKTAF